MTRDASGSRRLYAIGAFLVSVLESRVVSFWLLGAWIAMTVVWIVPFQLTGQPAETIRAIAEDWLVLRAIYAAVGITTLACAWTRAARDLRRFSAEDPARPTPTATAEPVAGIDIEWLGGWLRARGYRVATVGDRLSAVRNPYSLLGGSLFHFGIVLLGMSLVGHLLTVNTTTLRITEGQTVEDAAAASGIGSLPAQLRYMTLESIEPEYHEDVLLFTQLDARMTTADGRARSFSLSRPQWLGPTMLLSISDYNLAPHFEVRTPDGATNEYVVAMNLSPPGAEDQTEIPNVPLNISIAAYPDHGVFEGRDVSLSYNINNPAFLVSLSDIGRNGTLLARELVAIGEPVSAAGHAIRISGLSRYGTFRLTRAPAVPFMALSFITLTAGVVWRYVLRRRTVMAWASPDGVLVDGWLDMGGRAIGRHQVVEELRKAVGRP